MEPHGATLMNKDDVEINYSNGHMGQFATVYQAECRAITEGIELKEKELEHGESVDILVDN